MQLHGPTLTLRLPEPEDVDALFALASDPAVTRWFSWGPYERREEAASYLLRLPGQRRRGEQLDLIVVNREHGRPIGITGLNEFSLRDRRCMVGTWFGRDWWGTGANRESKAAMAHLAFEVLGMHRLSSYSNPENVRSTRALEGVGFTREGMLRQWHRHGERWLDVNVFRLLRDEWEAGDLRREVEIRAEGDPPPAFLSS